MGSLLSFLPVTIPSKSLHEWRKVQCTSLKYTNVTTANKTDIKKHLLLIFFFFVLI